VLLRLRSRSQIRFDRFEAGELLGGIFIGDGCGDDYVVARLPVCGRSHGVLGRELQRVDDAQDLVEVAARGHGIAELQLNLFVRTDDEHGAHGGVECGRAAFAGVPGIAGQHAVELGDFQLRIADHRIVHLRALGLFDVGLPLAVLRDGVDAQADDLCVALGEFRLQLGHGAEFGGADGREIFGMRKQNRPAVADPFVEVNLALRGFGGEVGCNVIDAGDAVGLCGCGRHSDFSLVSVSL
jgi:hypothetical protein